MSARTNSRKRVKPPNTSGGRNFTAPPTTPFRVATNTSSDFVSALRQAAEHTFQLQKRLPRKPWITDETLNALQEARAAEAEALPTAKPLRNKAKRMARKDRIKWVYMTGSWRTQGESPRQSGVWQNNRKEGSLGSALT